jgi:hypothetical protein
MLNKPYKAVYSWGEMFPNAAPDCVKDAQGTTVAFLSQSMDCNHPGDPDPKREVFAKIIVDALNRASEE